MRLHDVCRVIDSLADSIADLSLNAANEHASTGNIVLISGQVRKHLTAKVIEWDLALRIARQTQCRREVIYTTERPSAVH